jgi:hypothetical protein
MSYRDDRDADQARIAALERELAVARDRLARPIDKRAARGRAVALQQLFDLLVADVERGVRDSPR